MLSIREKQVLQLIFEGHTDQELSEILAISPNTARKHRENLRKKMKVNNTASMIRMAVELKLVNRKQ